MRRFLLALGVVCAWVVISIHPIWKYLPHSIAAAATLLSVFLQASGIYWLDQLNRTRREISTGWFLLLLVALSIAFSVLYPRTLRQPLSARSDRRMPCGSSFTAVRQHNYPYDARTFLRNPPTPLPGAMLLAAPFFAVQHIAWQSILWLALFFVFTIRFFRYRATALLFLALFLLFAPANLYDFVSGGDYQTNFFYVAIAVALLAQSLDRSTPSYLSAALFLGIVLSSRGIYVLIFPPLAAFALQRTSRSRFLISFAVVLAAAAAVTLPVFTPHPLVRLAQELHQASVGKLHFIPAELHPQWTLLLAGVMASIAAFYVRMDLSRVFLVFSVASFVMLAPFAAAFAMHGLPQRLAYLSVCSMAFSLWALSRYEATATPDKE